jgi:flagella basal body P-ring formation protein FlgA
VAQTVYRGEVIDATDLTTITLQGNTIAQAVPAADLDSMIGKRAAVDLVAGSVLVASAVTDESIPATVERSWGSSSPLGVRRPAC